MAISARALRFGRAVIELGLTTKDFEKQLDKSQTKFQKFMGTVAKFAKVGAAAGAAAVAASLVSLKTFVRVGDQLSDMAKRTGFTVEALSALKFAAEQSGSSLEGVEAAAKGMSKFFLEAEKGTKKAADTLMRLGLTVEDLRKLTPEERFRLLADAISRVEDPTMRAALATKAFGAAGVELLPLLNQGAGALDKLRKKAFDLGVIMSTDSADAAAELDDKLKELHARFEALQLTIGGPLANALLGLIELFGGARRAAGGLNDELDKGLIFKNPIPPRRVQGAPELRHRPAPGFGPLGPMATRSTILAGRDKVPFIKNRIPAFSNTGLSKRIFQGFRDAVAAGQVKVEAKLMRARFELQKHGVMDAIEAAQKKLKEKNTLQGIQREGIFSTRFASQIFGGSNPQTVLLAKIERNTRVKGKEGIRVV